MKPKRYSDTLGCQNTDCRYRQRNDGSCEYYIVEGHTRTWLHLGENVDINNPCREYRPGESQGRQALRIEPL